MEVSLNHEGLNPSDDIDAECLPVSTRRKERVYGISGYGYMTGFNGMKGLLHSWPHMRGPVTTTK